MNQTGTIRFADVLDAVDALGLFDNATATVQRHDGTVDGVGRPTLSAEADWDDLTGHVDLECMAAHDIFMTNVTRSKEEKSALATAETTLMHVLFNGHYPTILQSDRLILTKGGGDPITLDITGVEADSQDTMTRLAVQVKRL